VSPRAEPRGPLTRAGRVGCGDEGAFEACHPERSRGVSGPEWGLDCASRAKLRIPGQAEPVLSVDTGGVGEGERIPNFPVGGRGYLLRVREHWLTGHFPTENISDSYQLTWHFIEPAADDESEVNDSLELANLIAIGARRRGYIGWSGDVDTYCVSGEPGSLRARLSAVQDVDLVLRVVDRDRGRSRSVDEGQTSEGEVSQVVADARAGRVCFEVSAEEAAEGRAAGNPSVPYTLTLEAVQAPAEEPETP